MQQRVPGGPQLISALQQAPMTGPASRLHTPPSTATSNSVVIASRVGRRLGAHRIAWSAVRATVTMGCRRTDSSCRPRRCMSAPRGTGPPSHPSRPATRRAYMRPDSSCLLGLCTPRAEQRPERASAARSVTTSPWSRSRVGRAVAQDALLSASWCWPPGNCPPSTDRAPGRRRGPAGHIARALVTPAARVPLLPPVG